ncbi:MAG: porin family protein [Prevotellaceae bacterium]|jgi:outer membrane protein X|nr:porin family protein [Prevotellaceae bacterium]
MKVLQKMAMMLTIVAASAVTVAAQEKGDMAAGVNFAVGMGDELTNFGFGAKFQYNVIAPLRLEGVFTYFLPKTEGVEGIAESKTSMWDLSVNAHYLFPLGEKVAVYPLAGVGILGVTSSVEMDLGEFGGGDADMSASSSDFGVNLGGGIDFKLTEVLILNAEAKYKIGGDFNRFIISAGVAYKF